MNRISRYLFTQVLVAVLFSCLAITLVVWFSQSIRLLAMVINSGGSIWAFLKLMCLVLPSFFPLVLPLALMVGCLFVFNRMTAENELVVMRAVGMSPLTLAKPALALAAIIALIGYLMTMWIAPAANHELVRLQYEIRNDFSLLLLRTGSFHDLSKGMTFYARSRGEDGELKGLLIQDQRHPEKAVTIMAESGEMIRTEKGPNILVKNGIRQELQRATGNLSQLTFRSYLVDLTTFNDNFTSRWREPRERSMWELLNPQGEDRDPLTRGRFMAEFHLRLTMPMLAITFCLFACVAMLTGGFERRGFARKIAAVAVIVILLEAAMLSGLNLVARQPWLFFMLYALSLGPIPFLVHRLRTDRGGQRPGHLPQQVDA